MEGHGFSRAVRANKDWALAPEVSTLTPRVHDEIASSPRPGTLALEQCLLPCLSASGKSKNQSLAESGDEGTPRSLVASQKNLMLQAAGMPTLRKSRSVGQPISWWCPRPANLGQPPFRLGVNNEYVLFASRIGIILHRFGSPNLCSSS